MRDYEIDRINAQIEELDREQEQLRHSITRTKRDEQFEIERVKRDFALRINSMEERQQEILHELMAKRQQLKRAELLAREQQGTKSASLISDAKDRRLGRNI